MHEKGAYSNYNNFNFNMTLVGSVEVSRTKLLAKIEFESDIRALKALLRCLPLLQPLMASPSIVGSP